MDVIILALRMLAIAAIAFAIARPRWGDQPLVGDNDSGATVRVVLLDASQSLAAVQHGAANFERSRAVAAGHLKYRPGLRANLIVAGARPKALFASPSQNFEALRDALDKARVTAEELEVNRAIELAGQMLAPQSPDDRRRRELVIVSDFQRTNWAKADFGQLPADTQIQLESVAPETSPPNLAVLSARLRGRATLGMPVQLEVEVGNYSAAAQRVALDAVLGDVAVRLEGLCPAGRATVLAQDVKLATAGWHVGKVRLTESNDVLAADDERPLAIEVGNAPRYALLTRQRATQRPSSSYFLECALAPEGKEAPASSPQCFRIDPTSIDRQQILESDLIVVDHPGTLSQEAVSLLAGLLERGRPMLYVTADGTDARNLAALSQAAPAVKFPVQFAALATGQQRSNATVSTLRDEAAPFRVLGDNVLALMKQLRFFGGLATRRQADTLDDDVLASYSDGSALLVAGSASAASLVVLNADLGESTLPRSEAFVPLLDELVSDMLQRGRNESTAVAGQPLSARLPIASGSASLKIVGPSDTNDLGTLEDEAGNLVWRWPSPGTPGVYRVEDEGQTKYALAVGIAANESQLDSLPSDLLTSRLAAGRSVHYRAASGSGDTEDTVWVWVLTACVVCLLGELGALLAFRS